MNQCILLSGLSTSGKSFIGKLFCQKHGWAFIDGDWYFHKKKPSATISTGELVSNYDHPDAIDWKKMNASVNKHLLTKNVVVAFFMPLMEKFTFAIYKHIGLTMDITN